MSEHYIGLMSGTSTDGIDAALVAFTGERADTLNALTSPYPDAFRRRLLDAARARRDSLAQIAVLDAELGALLAGAARAVAAEAGFDLEHVTAIGSHGHTLRHSPDSEPPYTWQIGDPYVIARRTGVTTVADFRRADIAAGGHGAPLAPAFHARSLSASDETRAVLNLGGIANLTVLPHDGGAVLGFDTGPGNALMDEWIGVHRHAACDRDGEWAASGRVCQALLARLEREPYFAVAPPKSTGRELFNLEWLKPHLADGPSPADVQATLAELTASTVGAALKAHAPGAARMLVCGGGVHNGHLLARLAARSGIAVQSTAEFGVDPDWMEAIAFAWLAKRTLAGLPGNLPSVTGASREVVLGAICRA